ncbi:MAG: VWA domain-containing protein [Acidobacteria bacterium]|nr:MAG: VWA domain-containing protein [Acidobacteriota bacterium]
MRSNTPVPVFGRVFPLLLIFLMLGEVQLLSQKSRSPDDDQTLRVSVDLVNVLFTVTDNNGRLITNLNKEDLLVEEDGRKEQITYFSKEVTLPLTLAILIDTSPSVESILGLEKETAIEFLQTVLRKEDLALVMNFDRSVSLLQDFTSDTRRLNKAIQSVSIGSGTSVHDAVFLACDEKLKHETGRKAIILISDGGDTTSKLRIKDGVESAQRADVIIYAISNRVGGFFFGGYGGDDGTLKKYAETTGGKAFFPSKPQDFKKAFDAIQEELRSQYSLAYNSSNPAKDGSYRALKISLPNQKNLKIRAKKGYYAPKS